MIGKKMSERVVEGKPRLMVRCVECPDKWILVSWPMDPESLPRRLFALGWFVSAASKEGIEGLFMAPICPECAKAVHHPEVVAEVKKVMGREIS